MQLVGVVDITGNGTQIISLGPFRVKEFLPVRFLFFQTKNSTTQDLVGVQVSMSSARVVNAADMDGGVRLLPGGSGGILVFGGATASSDTQFGSAQVPIDAPGLGGLAFKYLGILLTNGAGNLSGWVGVG